ncbi:MAG: hypothetical protein IJF17_05120 [Thermoguttaceae bacterium]|nr:hypothetical protein [Thermoguttaceae bacterium]
MSKRSFLLILFLMFGFLPTAILLLFGTYRHLDWYTKNYASELGELFGLPVRVEMISHHSPGNGRIHGITVFQPGETQDPLATAPWGDWFEYDILREGKEVRLIKWTLPELTLADECLEVIWTKHQRLLEQAEKWKNREIVLSVKKQVRVGEEANAIELIQAEARIHLENGEPQTDVVFQIPEDNGQNAQIVLSLKRVMLNHSELIQATITTDTRGISTRYLKGLFPMLEQLGEEARFTGSIAVQQSFSRWTGLFRGRFDLVDTKVLFPNGGLAGWGTLNVEKARFDGAQLILADGDFRVTQGMVSRKLLENFMTAAQLITKGILEPGEKLAFQELAFRFQIRDGQMQIFGNCQGVGAGIYLTGSHGPILSEPTFLRQPFSRTMFWEKLLTQ